LRTFSAGPVGEGAAALEIGFLCQQQAAHVRMNDDRVGRFVLGLGAGQRTHLDTVLGVGERVLISDFGQAQALHTHAQPRAVHHHEHRRQTAVRFAHQPALGAVEVDDAGGIAVDAHFVLYRAAFDAVALPRLAVRVGQELRHDEQRNALGAGRSVRQARQHQVHDVVRQIVFASGDENLAAADVIGAVSLRLGLAAQQSQIGAAMRLGQTHGAGPFAGHQLGQVQLLQLGRAVRT
jgi:hypothetical protein